MGEIDDGKEVCDMKSYGGGVKEEINREESLGKVRTGEMS